MEDLSRAKRPERERLLRVFTDELAILVHGPKDIGRRAIGVLPLAIGPSGQADGDW